MKHSKMVFGLSLAVGLTAAASAQTILKIGYATTKESHYGVDSTVFL